MGGLSYIPTSSIIGYAYHIDMTDTERDLLLKILRQIDIAYVTAANSKEPNK